MKIFQIFNDKAHWLTPFESVQEARDRYDPAPLLFVEAPEEVEEGWLYSTETNTFTEPPIIIPTPSNEERISILETAQSDTDLMLIDLTYEMILLELGV